MILEKIYVKPETVDEALGYAQKYEQSFKFLAGGTDVLVNKFQGNDEADCLIDITGISELGNIKKENGNLYIGSLITLEGLNEIPEILHHFPTLIKAANEVASPMLRKTATIGGNILCENRCSFFNQSEWWREAVGYCLKCDGDICIATGGKKACFSKFVSDTVPVLVSMNARILVEDINGEEEILLESIYTGDGIKPRSLSPTALIKFIVLPMDKGYITVFKKLRPREAVDFTSLTTAVTVNNEGKVRIAIGGIDPKPVVVDGLMNGDYEEIIKACLRQARVVDNDYYSRSYRREMIRVFLEQSFESLIK